MYICLYNLHDADHCNASTRINIELYIPIDNFAVVCDSLKLQSSLRTNEIPGQYNASIT